MDLKIVYDNEAKSGFRKGWGFSCLLEDRDEKILFDVGWDGKVLLHNLQEFGIDIQELDRVFLSHSHWDHIGGLTHLENSGLHVYVPESFSKNLKRELSSRYHLHEVRDMEKITGQVWTTGELENKVGEQSIFIETENGSAFVITGCSHPKVENIFSRVSEEGKIGGILGGMHDLDELGVLEGLDKIVPCHCTSNKEKIVEKFPKAAVKGKAGLKVRI